MALQVHVLFLDCPRCSKNRKFAIFVDGTGTFLSTLKGSPYTYVQVEDDVPRQDQCNVFSQHVFIVSTCATPLE